MKTFSALFLASALILSSCSDKEGGPPRPIANAEDLVGETFHFKVKSEDWIVNGIPGDDTYGFAAKSNVAILTNATINQGQVRIYLQRGSNNWHELPSQAHQGAPYGVNWRFSLHPGMVRILIDRNGENFEPPSELCTFKIVTYMSGGMGTGDAPSFETPHQ
jgi:hypothetical protein